MRRPALATPARAVGRSPASRNATVGPHAAQAFGCAWKRRSAGSWYSRAHAGQSANGAIVVFGRSYGTRSVIE